MYLLSVNFFVMTMDIQDVWKKDKFVKLVDDLLKIKSKYYSVWDVKKHAYSNSLTITVFLTNGSADLCDIISEVKSQINITYYNNIK